MSESITEAGVIIAVRYELKNAVQKYNTYPPHENLGGSTPMAFIQKTISEAAGVSHIMGTLAYMHT